MSKYTENMIRNATTGNVFDFKDNFERAIAGKLNTAISDYNKVVMGNIFTNTTIQAKEDSTNVNNA